MSSLPLRQFPAVHTKSLDEATAIFSRMTTPARFHDVERGAPFEWRTNVLSLGGAMKLTANEYGASVRVSGPAVRDIFSIAFPLLDVPTMGFDGKHEYPVAPDRVTWFVSPQRSSGFAVGTGYRGLALTFSRADIEAALASFIGPTSVTAPLEIDPRMSLSSGVGAWLQRFTRFIADEADREGSAFVSPIVRARLADTILFGILEGHRHTYSDRLAATRAAEPAYVREAAAYLDANATQPVQLADLARVTGVGVRALQLGFQKHRGCTPMAFLKERRLQLARVMLLANLGRTVKQVALACGFVHVGRFSLQYRARFGESPVETLARSKSSS